MFGWLHPQGPPSGETQYLHPHLWQSPVQRAAPVAKAKRTLTAADLFSRAMYAARAVGRADAKYAQAASRAGLGLRFTRKPGSHEAFRVRRMDGLRTRLRRGVSKSGDGRSSGIGLPKMPAYC